MKKGGGAMKAALFDVGDTLVHKWVHKRDRFPWLCEQAGLAVPADTAARLRAAQAVERFFQARQSHPHVWTEAWWTEHNAIGLSGWGLTEYVDYVGDSDVYGARKPDPSFFLHVLEQLGVDPSNAFHVGDSWGADVVGARAAGVKAVLFDPLGCEDRPADHVIGELRELYALLNGGL